MNKVLPWSLPEEFLGQARGSGGEPPGVFSAYLIRTVLGDSQRED